MTATAGRHCARLLRAELTSIRCFLPQPQDAGKVPPLKAGVAFAQRGFHALFPRSLPEFTDGIGEVHHGVDIDGVADQFVMVDTATNPYRSACARGADVDKPRNLAKSVTME